jgi:SAM-dependent methyltransferase
MNHLSDREDVSWNARHSRRNALPSPDPWLVSAAPVLARGLPGPALDLACGLGQNALWLARLGLDVVGVDESPEGIQRARDEARRTGLAARFEVCRLEAGAPLSGRWGGPWGGIFVFHFLDRALFDTLARDLNPQGFLVYKTHLAHPLRAPGSRPRRPDYLLRPGELINSFAQLEVLAYREWAEGGNAFAALLARKPQGHSL